MPKNSQVTGRERVLPAGLAIVSHTDGEGRITCVNDAFIEASGYSRDELIGEHHNIVRHPDMPEEAFRDLWATVKRGQPWQGMVKNRCKNGDHYWVFATVTPLVEGGYMSARTTATRAQIDEAEALYRRMRENPRIRLEQGHVSPTGLYGIWFGLEQRIRSLPLLWKIFLPILLGGAAFTTVFVFQFSRLEDKVLAEAGRSTAESIIDAMRDARQRYAGQAAQKDQATGLMPTNQHNSDPHGIRLSPRGSQESGEVQDQDEQTGKLRLFSRYPFKSGSSGETQLDGFEQQALAYLEKNPQREFARVETLNGNVVYRLAVSDTMSNASCVQCHNGHPDSPKRDWKLGDVSGVAAVTVDMGETLANLRKPLWGLLGSMLLAGLVLLAVIWLLLGQVSRRLSRAEAVARSVAALDLTQPVPLGGQDEIGRVSNQLAIMRNRLFEMVFGLRQGVVELEETAQALSASSQQTAGASENQAAAVSGMASATEQMASSVQEVGSLADEAHAFSRESDQAAADGATVVHQAADEIGRISSAVSEAAASIGELEGISREIGQIVGTIREIADQTNLLALNAAIEAARAGEAGRGFAVVADEVRNLAERTAQSTVEITDMVERIQARSKAAVAEMEKGVQRVQDGVRLAHAAGDSVAGIRDKASRVVEAAARIREVLAEESTAAAELAEQVGRIASMAEQNVGASQQTFQSSYTVAAMIGKIKELAEQFKVGEVAVPQKPKAESSPSGDIELF